MLSYACFRMRIAFSNVRKHGDNRGNGKDSKMTASKMMTGSNGIARRLLGVFAAAALLIGGATAATAQVGGMSAETQPKGMLMTPLGHKAAPLDFTLKDVNTGKPVRLSSLRGKVVVVNFWSTACPACREELPTLQKLWRKMKGMDVAVLTVHIGGDAEKVRAFLKEKGVNMPVLLDDGENVAKSWGALHLPVTYVLNPDGKLAFVAYGARNWQNPQIARLLTALISPLHGNEE